MQYMKNAKKDNFGDLVLTSQVHTASQLGGRSRAEVSAPSDPLSTTARLSLGRLGRPFGEVLGLATISWPYGFVWETQEYSLC